jgi:hypothetical protein
LDAQAVGRAGEAPHFRDRYENEDGFEILHFRPLALFTAQRTVSSFHRRLSRPGDTVISMPRRQAILSENDKCLKP